jgi:hypothetical protein
MLVVARIDDLAQCAEVGAQARGPFRGIPGERPLFVAEADGCGEKDGFGRLDGQCQRTVAGRTEVQDRMDWPLIAEMFQALGILPRDLFE